MTPYEVLEFQNENALAGYPLIQGLEVSGILVDASFIQFDNFVPILNSIQIDADRLTLTITFDCGLISNIVLLKQSYNAEGGEHRHLRIYQTNPKNPDDLKYRYLGVVCFGSGVEQLWLTYIGRKLLFNLPFAANTVRSIPLNDGVYMFDGNYGEVSLGRTSTDSAMFYNFSPELNSITFNAVSGHSIISNNGKGLKSINLVKPINNNINLASNDIVKITPTSSAATLSFDLVAGSPSGAFKLPSLYI
jgi:hypothetical protein